MEVNARLLDFESVRKVFPASPAELLAIDSVSFEVKRDEFVTLVGPSGCGKTTILRIGAGLDQPTSGRVVFDGHEVTQPDRRRPIVTQSYSIFPWLTAYENIAFGISNMSRRDRRERVNEWLARIDLVEFANSYPNTLSGGMRQRIALARALIVDPEIVLCDEVLGALDEHTRVEMQLVLLKALEIAKCSALLVTHSIREALAMSNRIVVLSSRPARILDEITISLPRPRPLEFEQSKEFGELYRRIFAHLSRHKDDN